MFRFSLSKNRIVSDVKQSLKRQTDIFLSLDELKETYTILDTNENDISVTYNARVLNSNKVIETQDLIPIIRIEEHKKELYSLLWELGFFSINQPISSDYNRIVILGGSLSATFDRVLCAKKWINKNVKSVSGLTCFRPINPIERRIGYDCSLDTEFTAMSNAFLKSFGLTEYDDSFESNVNINSVTCIREFKNNDIIYTVYACPSGDAMNRRADTGDTVKFFLEQSSIAKDDRLLFITNNRYVNRQFLQIAFKLIECEKVIDFDIVGCNIDNYVNSDTYNPSQYIQDLISILDWIKKINFLNK